MIAKYDGYCKVTGQKIVAGKTEIVKVDGKWQAKGQPVAQERKICWIMNKETGKITKAIGNVSLKDCHVATELSDPFFGPEYDGRYLAQLVDDAGFDEYEYVEDGKIPFEARNAMRTLERYPYGDAYAIAKEWHESRRQ